MNSTLLEDFANQSAQDVAKYKVDFILSAEQLRKKDFVVPNLEWDYVSFASGDMDKIPNDRGGVYAFAINVESDILPPHSYILYVGIAGKNSDRALRDRYKDYLNEKMVMRRVRIARMIGAWKPVLRFYYAPVDNTVSSEVLKTLEEQLNTALLPPFSEGDIDAEVKSKRRAYRV